MATADQVKALIRSHAEGDDTKFYSVALQVAARAARGGHSHFAQELRDLVDIHPEATAPLGLSEPTHPCCPAARRTRPGCCRCPTRRRGWRTLSSSRMSGTGSIGSSWSSGNRTVSALQGFRPTSPAAPHWATGNGQDDDSERAGGRPPSPLFIIRLDGLITKFMGETAAKLRLVFDALSETRGVYLFDEVDALGGERARTNDVGEIRRVLNSFLQFLEQDESDSLLVAATNHPQMLDRAMFRRFDAVIEYPLPTPGGREGGHPHPPGECSSESDRVGAGSQSCSTSLSHAEITLAAERAAKDAILAKQDVVTTPTLVAALRERQARSRTRVSMAQRNRPHILIQGRARPNPTDGHREGSKPGA